MRTCRTVKTVLNRLNLMFNSLLNKILPLILLFFIVCADLFAQVKMTLQLEQNLNSTSDSVYFDVYIKRVSATFFRLGTSDFVIEIDTTILDINAKTIVTRGIWDKSNTGDTCSYLYMDLGPSTPSNTTYINLTVRANTSCTPVCVPSGSCGIGVPFNNRALVGRIAIKVKQCGKPITSEWRFLATNDTPPRGDITDYVTGASIRRFVFFQPTKMVESCPAIVDSFKASKDTICRTDPITYTVSSYSSDSVFFYRGTTLLQADTAKNYTTNINQDSIYAITKNISCNCLDTTDIIPVRIYDFPVIASQLSDSIICENSSAVLFVEGATSQQFQWQISTDNIFFSNTSGLGANGPIFWTSPLNDTSYFRCILSNASRCTTITNPITIFTVPRPRVRTFDKPDTAVCVGGTVNLVAHNVVGTTQWQTSPNGILNWIDIAGVTDTNTVSPPLTTSSYFRLKTSTPCDSSFSNVHFVRVFSPSQGIFNTVIPDVCVGDTTIPLGAQVTSGSGKWSTPNGKGGFSNSDDPNARYVAANVDGGVAVQLNWTVSNGPCSDSVYTKFVNVLDKPLALFSNAPLPICAGNTSAPMGATAVNGTGFWLENGLGSMTNPNNPNAQYISTQAEAGDTVDISWIVGNGICKSDTTIQRLIISAEPFGAFNTNLPSLCAGDSSLPLGGHIDVGIGQWASTGQGVFYPSPFDSNAVYISSPSDSNTTVTISWEVSSPGCASKIYTQAFPVSSEPLGDYLVKPDTICAGGKTDSLDGITIRGTGFWVTSNGSGTFDDPNNPESPYLSDTINDPTLPNGNVQLCWVVVNGSCVPDSNCQLLHVLNMRISGSFSVKPDSICIGDRTKPLGATAVNGIGRWTHNGAGYFLDSLDGNTRYVSNPLDAGKTIQLKWTITNSFCKQLAFTQNLKVYNTPYGVFATTPPPVCAGNTSVNLGAFAFVGTGRWAQGANGLGTFLDNKGLAVTNLDPNGKYTSNPANAGDTIDIYWITSNGPCKEDTITRKLIIGSPPAATFPVGPPMICAGGNSDTLVVNITSGSGIIWDDGSANGAFYPPNKPRSIYYSNLIDAGQTVTLTAKIYSPGCDTLYLTQPIQLSNTIIEGYFSNAPSPICITDTTQPLNSSVVSGTGSWEASVLGGQFIPNIFDTAARYIPPPTVPGVSDTITLIWRVSNGVCNDLLIPQPLIVYNIPDGSIVTTPPPVCFGSISDTLRVQTNIGVGAWVHFGTGGFDNSNKPDAKYIPGPGDVGTCVPIAWVVTNGPCTVDSNFTTICIDAVPAGGFFTNVPSVCAGSPTVPLAATISTGKGKWYAVGGNGGYFDNDTIPNATYFTNPVEAGTTIRLYWIVTNGVCSSDTNFQDLQVLNTSVGGTFNTTLDSICALTPTIPLGATISAGTGRWTATINGNPAGGTFSPSDLDSNAVYIPPISAVGRNINICWNITNGNCNELDLCQTLFVRNYPAGEFVSELRPICAGDTSDTLRAIVSFGTGKWVTLNGLGTFSDSLRSDSVVYFSHINDPINVSIVWVVSAPGCVSDSNFKMLRVYEHPQGDFSTAPDSICAGTASAPLGATLTVGFGQWECTNCIGGFTAPSTDPNARYVALVDPSVTTSSKPVTLTWVITNGPCDTVRYNQDIVIQTPSLGAFLPPANAEVCYQDTSDTLRGKAIYGQGFWTTSGSGSFSPNNTDTNVVYIAGSADKDTAVTITWTVINGKCDPVQYQQYLFVYDVPLGDFSTPLDTVCAGYPSIPLGATLKGAYSYGRWSHNGAGSFSDANNPNARYLSVRADGGDTITLTWTVFNGPGCDSISYSQLLFVRQAVATVNPDTSLCLGDTVRLMASGGTFYSWRDLITGQPGQELSDPNVASPYCFATQSRAYLVQVQDNLGCVFQDTVQVIVRQPDTTTVSTNVFVCSGDSIQIFATNGLAYHWVGEGISSPNSAVTYIKPTQTQLYDVFIYTASGCTAKKQVLVTVYPTPEPVITGKDICVGLDLVLRLENDGTCVNRYWFRGNISQVLSSGNPDQTNPRFIHQADTLLADSLKIGAYTFTFACRNIQGCIGLDEYTFNVSMPPLAGLTGDTVVRPYNNRRVRFTDTSVDAVRYLWDFGDPASDTITAADTVINNISNLQNPNHFFSQPGTYSIALYVENELGCGDIYVATNYVIIKPPRYDFPTAFSPNGDGINDIFRPLPADNTANVLFMQIYDRWGKLVFESTNDPKGWDGKTPSGEPFDVGAYSYKVMIELPIIGPTLYTGNVSLVK